MSSQSLDRVIARIYLPASLEPADLAAMTDAEVEAALEAMGADPAAQDRLLAGVVAALPPAEVDAALADQGVDTEAYLLRARRAAGVSTSAVVRRRTLPRWSTALAASVLVFVSASLGLWVSESPVPDWPRSARSPVASGARPADPSSIAASERAPQPVLRDAEESGHPSPDRQVLESSSSSAAAAPARVTPEIGGSEKEVGEVSANRYTAAPEAARGAAPAPRDEASRLRQRAEDAVRTDRRSAPPVATVSPSGSVPATAPSRSVAPAQAGSPPAPATPVQKRRKQVAPVRSPVPDTSPLAHRLASEDVAPSSPAEAKAEVRTADSRSRVAAVPLAEVEAPPPVAGRSRSFDLSALEQGQGIAAVRVPTERMQAAPDPLAFLALPRDERRAVEALLARHRFAATRPIVARSAGILSLTFVSPQGRRLVLVRAADGVWRRQAEDEALRSEEEERDDALRGGER